MRRQPVSAVLLALGATVTLTGCNAYDEPDEPAFPTDWILEQPAAPQPADPLPGEPELGPVPGSWFCTYEPALDDDWRDDVVCSNGFEEQWPYLGEWDALSTEDEIWEAVLEYEEYLNAGFAASEGG